MTPAEFGAYREMLGLTHAELAHRLNVSLKSVLCWESGTRPIRKIVELAMLGLMAS